MTYFQAKISYILAMAIGAGLVLSYAWIGLSQASAELADREWPATLTNLISFAETGEPVADESETSANAAADDPEAQIYNESMERAVWPSGPQPTAPDGSPVLYPELRPICSCESSYHGTWWDAPRHYENGNVLRNYDGNDDVGLCQINLTTYGEMAQKLGYDLYSPEGNILFANWLFEQKGSAPWYKSEKCWRKSFTEAPPATLQ
jgi:hypothetical protein